MHQGCDSGDLCEFDKDRKSSFDIHEKAMVQGHHRSRTVVEKDIREAKLQIRHFNFGNLPTCTCKKLVELGFQSSAEGG